MSHLLFVLASIASLSFCYCAVIPSFDPVSYLSKYGYIKGSESRFDPKNIITTPTLTKAIEKYQNYFNLEVTGEMNSETEHLMSQPRCGVPDNLQEINSRLTKRFVILESKWMKRNLTYKVHKYPKRLSEENVNTEIQRAFNIWTNHVDLRIRLKKLGKVDINLSFEYGDHGCIWGFDGTGGTLAHAYSPGHPDYTGDAHFDAAEYWSVNSTEGVNLFQVAVHEFGHSLGLDHSNDRRAIMYPIYGKQSDLQLDRDDILGIQELYGIKNKTSSRRLKVVPKLCNISTIFNVNDKIMMFKGSRFYQMNESGVVENSSMAISSKWFMLPEGIDAAFNYLNNKTFFFKGSKYWRYSNGSMDEDYPKEIDIGFPGVPDSIDAVTTLSNDEVIYFFKGDLFWTFDSSNMLQGKQCFSMEIPLKFKGLPNNVDGAFKHSDGHVHFVKNNKLYRFNEVLQKVDQVLEHNWRC